jgi:serine/threonine protein kinase
MSEDAITTVKNEVEILGKMDHPNIVKLYEFYDCDDHLCLVQEIVAGGELYDAIIK